MSIGRDIVRRDCQSKGSSVMPRGNPSLIRLKALQCQRIIPSQGLGVMWWDPSYRQRINGAKFLLKEQSDLDESLANRDKTNFVF